MQNKIELSQKQNSKPELEVGQFWKSSEGELFLLAHVTPGRYALVCLDDGDHWNGPYKDIVDVFGSRSIHDFTLITQPFTVTPGV